MKTVFANCWDPVTDIPVRAFFDQSSSIQLVVDSLVTTLDHMKPCVCGNGNQIGIAPDSNGAVSLSIGDWAMVDHARHRDQYT